MKLSTGILAGGKSTRMGQNKALLTINEKRFIDKIADELGSFSEVLISAAQKGVYEDAGYRVVYDEHKEIGPIEGIYQILRGAKEDYVFICAADMPFVTKDLVSYMAEFISSDYDCYVMMDEEHIHPLCAIYSKNVLEVIEKQISEGCYRLMNILNNVRTKYIRLEYTCFDKKVVKNINTRQEYQKLALPVVFCVSAVKDSGKTGLIIKLINEFIKENYSVGVIKHDGHDYVMDHSGTDTYRFANAGAVYSAIFSDRQFSVNGACSKDIGAMISMMEDTDVIIIEGMKHSEYPKIEIVRGAVSQETVCDPKSLICIATDVVSRDNVSCPVYGLDDIGGIFSCVKKYFGLERQI
ncbi:MAG: molybdopterin-guanine dinucleotide biosynthesis protein B [Alistipes sp.]|nr:molybdopterin-guanine dinucleotide biosynthesis protein B [Alistipes sp.]